MYLLQFTVKLYREVLSLMLILLTTTTGELMEIDYLNNTLEMDYKGRKIILQVNAQDGEDFELDANFAEELKKQLQETTI